MSVYSPAKGTRLLFVPVSSAEGIGEYMRSLIIAQAVQQKWPEIDISFILNSDAPYATQCPFSYYLLDETPTKRVAEVNRIVSDVNPDVVVFDASGRRSQLQHAKQVGAAVVFISQHRRKRSRGLKWARAKVTDSHWVAQPEFLIGPLSWFEKLKLTWLNKPAPIFIGPVFRPPDEARQSQLLVEHALQHQHYFLFNAGSGGHIENGEWVADIFAKAAALVYRQLGIKCVVVFGPNYTHKLPTYEGVVSIGAVDHIDFINLIQGAEGVVLAGGDTLLQALALGVPTVAVSVSKDQFARVASCVSEGLCLEATNNPQSITDKAISLLNLPVRAQLVREMNRQALQNGLHKSLSMLESLLQQRAATLPPSR